jgi:hypothetical protein
MFIFESWSAVWTDQVWLVHQMNGDQQMACECFHESYVQLGIVCSAGVFQEAISKGVRNISFGDLSGKLGVTMYISSNVNYKFVFYMLKTGIMASVQLLWSNTRSVVSFTPGCKFTQGSDKSFWYDTGINLSSGYHHIFRL